MSTSYSDKDAKRNALFLSAAVGFGGANAPINFAIGGIVGGMLAPSPIFATAPITAFVLGSFLTAMPASLLMQAAGRKTGFMIGGAIGIVGGIVAAIAVLIASFPLFIIGTFLSGSYLATQNLYRFAAADLASPALKPKVIAWVLAGGLLGAVLGPQLVIHTKSALTSVLFVGPYVASAMSILVAMIILTFTRFPDGGVKADEGPPPRPLSEIAGTVQFKVAAICAMIAYALMNLVMTAAPIAMIGCGHTVDDAALGIQWHVIAMFLPSFFTGQLIQRYGVNRIIGLGMIILALCAVVAMAGISIAHFWIALVLLGVGWNFAYIGATTMVSGLHTPSERGKVQGLNDSLVFGLVSLASLAAGILQNTAGWTLLNAMVLPFVALGLLSLLWLSRQPRPTSA
jgi:predicted MFS family arabinose efflux permease